MNTSTTIQYLAMYMALFSIMFLAIATTTAVIHITLLFVNKIYCLVFKTNLIDVKKLNGEISELYSSVYKFQLACAAKQLFYYITGLWLIGIKILFNSIFVTGGFYTNITFAIAILLFLSFVACWPLFLFVYFFAENYKNIFIKMFVCITYLASWAAAACILNTTLFSAITNQYAMLNVVNVFMLFHYFIPVTLVKDFITFIMPICKLFVFKATYPTFLYMLFNVTKICVTKFVLLTLLINYFCYNICMYFYWGTVGVRGIFFTNECLILVTILQSIIYLVQALKCNSFASWILCELMLSDDLMLSFTVHLDLLAICGVIIVLILTAIILTFGVEYLSREAFAYNVLVILCTFSASIVWFIITFDLGFMTIFWELSGFFSLLLVDTFYTRVRTTQAVSRTFAISRFSDFIMLIGTSEIFSLFDSESLFAVFGCIKSIALESPMLITYIFESTVMRVTLFCFFAAAVCKCAQFVLFVWLPDAMEAPTPASALIHSSTLVVMGIFMLLRLMPLFENSSMLLSCFLITGSITVAYGSVCAIQTSDLKKAVAYSTISQVGYLLCGCGLVAVNETLVYLAVHAICKAMLFVFVGYIVHLFGGTTSMRKMGGIFYILPDVALYVFILCMILAGAPYTVGFYAKELIISKIICVKDFKTAFVLCCWFVSFVCTPIYLFRICVIPFFGRPRATWYRYKNIAFFKNRENYFAQRIFKNTIKNGTNPLFFFYNNIRNTGITSRLTTFLHFFMLLNILIFGEFIMLLITGFFNAPITSTLLTSKISSSAVLSIFAMNTPLFFFTQLLILVLFVTVFCYYYMDVKSLSKNSLRQIIFIEAIILILCATSLIVVVAPFLL